MSKYETKYEREEAVTEWFIKWFLVPLMGLCMISLFYVIPIGILVDLGWEKGWGAAIWLGIDIILGLVAVWAILWVRRGK